jgi:hypothetical protein
LFRLAGYVRLLFAKPEPRPGLMLAVTRDQSMFENYGFAVWFLLTNAAFLAPQFALPLPVALLLSVPLAALFIQIPCYLMGGIIVPLLTGNYLRNNHRLNLTMLFTLDALIAVYYLRQPSWARVVAWQFLALLGLNALAAVIVFLLRRRIARLEEALSFAA